MRIATVTNLSDWQRCRELTLFCQACYEQWEESVPRHFALKRYPCPHCKAEGEIIAVHNRGKHELP